MQDRIVRTYTQKIDASPDTVFPLICPVREAEWLDGWGDSCELIYSQSGFAEKGCVFRTRSEHAPETIWTISTHDPAARVVEFVRVTAGLEASTLRVSIRDGRSEGGSEVEVTYASTPLSDQGARYAAHRYDADGLRRSVAWWETSMNHYVRTGSRLPQPAAH